MTSNKIIRSYLTIAGLYTLSASLIWGVNTLFLLDAGLKIFEVFVTWAIEAKFIFMGGFKFDPHYEGAFVNPI